MQPRVCEITGVTTRGARSAYFDNAKAVLICLVVLGHVLELGLRGEPFWGAIYQTIYTFHMPAFVMIAGYFSKDRFSWGWARELGGLLALLVVFQGLYALYSAFFLGVNWTFEQVLTRPYWLIWYLVSLVAWKIAMPIAKHLWISLPLSVVLAIASGAVITDGGWLSIGRTFYFWPFFLAGYALRGRELAWESPSARIIAICTLCATAVLYLTVFSGVEAEWLWGRTFKDLKYPEFALEKRTLLLTLSAIASAALFQIVPRNGLSWTWLGRATLPIFLLHGFLVRGAKPLGLEALANHPAAAFIAVVLIIALTSSRMASSFTSFMQKIGTGCVDRTQRSVTA